MNRLGGILLLIGEGILTGLALVVMALFALVDFILVRPLLFVSRACIEGADELEFRRQIRSLSASVELIRAYTEPDDDPSAHERQRDPVTGRYVGAEQVFSPDF